MSEWQKLKTKWKFNKGSGDLIQLCCIDIFVRNLEEELKSCVDENEKLKGIAFLVQQGRVSRAEEAADKYFNFTPPKGGE